MTLVTKTEYAAMRGWGKSYLSNKSVVARIEPALEPHPDNPRRQLVNVEKADEIFRKTSDPSGYLDNPMARRRHRSGTAEFDQAKLDLIRTKNEVAKIELARLKESLLDREEVLQATGKVCGFVLAALLAKADHIGSTAAAMTDPREIKGFFDATIRETFQKICDDLSETLRADSSQGSIKQQS